MGFSSLRNYIYHLYLMSSVSSCKYMSERPKKIMQLLNYFNLILQSDDDPREEPSLETENSTKAIPGCSTWGPTASTPVTCERRADSPENRENGRNNEAEENGQENQTSQQEEGFQAVPVPSKAHLFIFDRESQDVESQSIFAERPAALARLQQTTNSEAAHSLSQIQLEEDRQRIRKLMEETKQVGMLMYLFYIF